MKWYWIIITLILIFSFFLRIPDIDRPLLDAHYFRQTQTATVVRNFYTQGIDFFHTRLDIFGDGKEQVLLLEFPFYQSVVAGFSYLLGFHDYVGRFISLIFAVLSGLILVLLANKLFSDKYIGLTALAFFIFNPLNFYFQQAYMIEATVIFLHLFAFYLWLKYTESQNNPHLFGAAVITSLAFIHKNIYAPFLLLSILGILYFRLKRAEFKKFRWLPAVLISLFVLFAWQYYVNTTNFQSGHSNFTLGDSSQQLWNFGTLYERFDVKEWSMKLNSIQNSVTKYQWPVFLLGIYFLIRKKGKDKSILFVWLLTMILYYLILFRIQSHDYYFMPVLPLFSIIAAYGLSEVVKLFKNKYIFTFFLIIYLYLFTYKSIQNSKMYFKVDDKMLDRLNTYNSVIGPEGNILFIFDQDDWNSVYTYYTHHKGRVFAAANVSTDIIRQYAMQRYKYVVIDGMPAIETISSKYPEIITTFPRLFSSGDLIILHLWEIKKISSY